MSVYQNRYHRYDLKWKWKYHSLRNCSISACLTIRLPVWTYDTFKSGSVWTEPLSVECLFFPYRLCKIRRVDIGSRKKKIDTVSCQKYTAPFSISFALVYQMHTPLSVHTTSHTRSYKQRHMSKKSL